MEVYVIRIGSRPDGEADTNRSELRGTVERIDSSDRESFRERRELLAFLHAEHGRQSDEVEQ